MIRLASIYSGWAGNRWEARASDLRNHPGLWWNRRKLRLYKGYESEYSPTTCSIGKPEVDTPCLRPIPLHYGVVIILTCYCGGVPSISPILFSAAILLLLSIEPTIPVPSRVASQWMERPSSWNGDYNGSEMAEAPPVGRQAHPTRTTPSNHVRTTLLFGAHSSSRLWSHQFPASCVTWTTSQRNCPNPIHQDHTPCPGFSSHQFPAS